MIAFGIKSFHTDKFSSRELKAVLLMNVSQETSLSGRVDILFTLFTAFLFRS